MRYPTGSLQLLRVVAEDAILTHFALAAPKSPLGVQLELVRLGLMGEIDEWKRSASMEWKFGRRALQVQLLARLSADELAVLVLATIPIGFETYTRTVPRSELRELTVPQWDTGDGACGAPLQNGNTCSWHREPGEPRCRRHHHVSSRPVVEITSRGEEAFDWTEDRAQVRGTRPTRCTTQQIASELGITRDQVRRSMTTIHEKMIDAPQLRLLAEAS